MEHIIAVTTLAFSLAGALITFGMLYGIIKTRQQAFDTSLTELKHEFKEEMRSVRTELKLFRQSCSKLCRFAVEHQRDSDAIERFTIEEDPE